MKTLISIAIVFVMAACAQTQVHERSDERRSWEYKNRDIRAVLNELTVGVGDRIVIADDVNGTVDVLFGDRSPREAREAIIRANALSAVERDGILYVSAKR